jgi:hypothetical protein
VCNSDYGNPVCTHAENDQKWKPSQLQIPVTVINRWKLLRSSYDSLQSAVKLCVELQSNLWVPCGVVPQGLSEIGFSSRTNLNRFHSGSPAALRARCRTTSQSAVAIVPWSISALRRRVSATQGADGQAQSSGVTSSQIKGINRPRSAPGSSRTAARISSMVDMCLFYCATSEKQEVTVALKELLIARMREWPSCRSRMMRHGPDQASFDRTANTSASALDGYASRQHTRKPKLLLLSTECVLCDFSRCF